MKICIVTDDAIGPSHGTGTLIRKYFAGTNSISVLGVSAQPSADADPNSTLLLPRRTPKLVPALRKLCQLQIRDALTSVFTKTSFDRTIESVKTFKPDLLWVIVWGPQGLRVAREIGQAIPALPCYSSFWDLFPDQMHSGDPKADLHYLLNRANYIDAISEPLVEELQPKTKKEIKVENFFCAEAPTLARGKYASNASLAKLVMVGNVWLHQAFESLVEIISLARQERRDFPEIIWYCHRSSLDRLNLCPTSLPDGFIYGGFRDDVSSEIALADLCIVPINGKNNGHSGYSRFSLPSRVSELYFSGVPVVAIADKETAFSRYIERTGTGVTLSPKNTVESKNILLALLDSQDDRCAYGKAGTEFARNHFEATAFRKRLRERLAMISNYKFPLELGRK